MKPTIIIPIYKEALTESERESLIQCCKILTRHDISLVCPTNLRLDEYVKIFDACNKTYEVERFDERFFRTISGYNLLMLGADFYRRFTSYEYMLVYQLDAYVFKDELAYWCEQGYDYVGAPWVNRFSFFRANTNLLRPGSNGGFSLRKVSSCMKVLGSGDQGNKVLTDYIKGGRNEDGFFSLCAVKVNPTFKVAPPDVAIRFSFERLPKRLYEMTNKELPFGCHAWLKYNPRFWKRFIHT